MTGAPTRQGSLDAVQRRGVEAARRLSDWIQAWEDRVRRRSDAGQRKADLYARARAAGVPGRSRMSKAELRDALERGRR